MDLLRALLLFFLNIGDDALAVLYVRRTATGKALQAGVLSFITTLVVSFSVKNYVDNYWYILPIAAGSGLGAWGTIVADKWWRRRRSLRNLKKRKPGGPYQYRLPGFGRR